MGKGVGPGGNPRGLRCFKSWRITRKMKSVMNKLPKHMRVCSQDKENRDVNRLIDTILDTNTLGYSVLSEKFLELRSLSDSVLGDHLAHVALYPPPLKG